ncbi:MAG: His/Gly/Thr/Pro-type tRNA ligase C-terminal domain-containing protein, partial [Patescibacteria group bacterium]
EEVYNDETLQKLGVTRDELELVKTAEVGNIFNFGRKKCEDVGLFFQKQDESKEAVWLGSYGIGITRLMGVIVEKFSDDKGIIWPESVAPFQVHLLSLGADEKAEEIYKALTDQSIEVLYDDRDKGAGEKFADADLMGMPYQVIVGKRSLESGKAEVKNRSTGQVDEVAFEELATYLTK